MQAVSVLFVRKDSIYKTMGVDCWDIDRDARNCDTGYPLVCHPPCRAWGRLAHFANPRPDEKELAVWSVHQIRKYGGVLEHPYCSKLWPHMNLPDPGSAPDKWGGYTVSVNQHWFGHLAEKKTLLYIVGCPQKELPLIPLNFNCVTHTVCSPRRRKNGSINKVKKEISKKQREETPPAFAEWLIEVARKCKTSIP